MAASFLTFLSSNLDYADDKENNWQKQFYFSMPKELQDLVDDAVQIKDSTSDTILRAVGLIDHTSLKSADVEMIGIETEEDVAGFCREAIGNKTLSTAAVCFYPNHIQTAREALTGSSVKLAVVNNFPHGNQSAQDAAEDTARSIAQGAQEIDTVIDYQAWQKGDELTVRGKFKAVSDVCKQHDAKLKTILKASVHETYESLYQAALIACEEGADFVKTCTGKEPLDGYGTGAADASNLLTMATVMQAVSDYNTQHNTSIGVKISGGVKYPVDCERMRFLVNEIMGSEYYGPSKMRIGASSLLKNLVKDQEADDPSVPESDY